MKLVLAALLSLLAIGCAAQLPAPGEIIPPLPIAGNGGEYYAPYTSDGVVAPWVDKGIEAKLGAAVGGATVGVGARIAAKTALSAIPFAGLFAGIAGDALGGAAGRKLAIEMCGGWELIRSSSDLSFDNLRDMVVWTYANYGESEHYAQVLEMIGEIYTEIPGEYEDWLEDAPRGRRGSRSAQSATLAAAGSGTVATAESSPPLHPMARGGAHFAPSLGFACTPTQIGSCGFALRGLMSWSSAELVTMGVFGDATSVFGGVALGPYRTIGQGPFGWGFRVEFGPAGTLDASSSIPLGAAISKSTALGDGTADRPQELCARLWANSFAGSAHGDSCNADTYFAAGRVAISVPLSFALHPAAAIELRPMFGFDIGALIHHVTLPGTGSKWDSELAYGWMGGALLGGEFL